MSNDELRWSPPDETHIDSPTEGEEKEPSARAETADTPRVAPLPDIAALPEEVSPPDLDELRRFAPPADNEAGATRAGTGACAQAHLATRVAPTPHTPREYPLSKLLEYAAPRPWSYRKHTTTTTRRSAATPTSAPAASARVKPAAATAPSQPRSDEDAPAASARIKLAFWSAWCVIALIVYLVRLGSNTNTSPPVSMPYIPSSQVSTTPSPGYSGTAHNTHALSPAWAAGISTAWTIPVPSGLANVTHPMYVEGSTLYVAFGVAAHATHSTYTVGAYDLSGRRPQALWATPVRADTSADQSDYEPAFVSGEDQIFFRGSVLDKATGEQASAPWGTDFPLAFADNIVVTCSTTTTCSGWTQEGEEWTNLWTTTTATQSGHGGREDDLGFAPAGTVVSGSGERVSVLVPTASTELPQIIDVHTGAVTTLSNPNGDATDRLVEVASDGFIVYDTSTSRGSIFDSEGNFQSTFTAEHNLPVPSMDGTHATTSQIETFMTQGRAQWASGTARMTGTGKCTLEVTLTADDSTREAPVPASASLYTHDDCSFAPKDLRVSADGSAVFVRSFSRRDQTGYVIDTADGSSATSTSLTQATQLTWVYDDMLIGMSKTGITAFVPASS